MLIKAVEINGGEESNCLKFHSLLDTENDNPTPAKIEVEIENSGNYRKRYGKLKLYPCIIGFTNQFAACAPCVCSQ